jgi:hypothetical protein
MAYDKTTKDGDVRIFHRRGHDGDMYVIVEYVHDCETVGFGSTREEIDEIIAMLQEAKDGLSE